MVLMHLSVVLDLPLSSYRPGDVVSGKVVLALDAEKMINGMYVKLKGATNVSWSESRSTTGTDGSSTTVSESFSARETLVDARVTLLGVVTVPSGQHCYPFSMRLPREVPPSYEGAHGSVRYAVKAALVKPWKLDEKVEVRLKIAGDVDLSVRPGLREPARAAREKTLCCCCCTSGTLTLVMHTPGTGLALGGAAHVTLEVDNATRSRVDSVLCKLTQKVEFKARGKVNRTQQSVASVTLGSVEPRRSCTFRDALSIPQDLPPSGLPHCGIITVSYYLTGKAKLSGPHVSPTVEIPVVLGNVAKAPPPVSAPPLVSAPPPEGVPPPSYDDSVFGTTYLRLPWSNKY